MQFFPTPRRHNFGCMICRLAECASRSAMTALSLLTPFTLGPVTWEVSPRLYRGLREAVEVSISQVHTSSITRPLAPPSPAPQPFQSFQKKRAPTSPLEERRNASRESQSVSIAADLHLSLGVESRDSLERARNLELLATHTMNLLLREILDGFWNTKISASDCQDTKRRMLS
jgi:hypothetical protein